MSRVRVFIACSVDGFIAGPNDELDWLAPGDACEDTFSPFFAGVGAMLMGRRTFDVASGFEGPWPYGDTPVLVATRRPLVAPRPSVRSVAGTIAELVAAARTVAGERDVYLDGGELIRSALDARLVDSLTVTLIPIILGAGVPLFAGARSRHGLELISQRAIGGGLVELVYRPVERLAAAPDDGA
jgi:dihydrofolate reductase